MLTRYSDNLLKLRGETIARKEAIESLNRAQYEGYEQAIENNVIDEKFVKKDGIQQVMRVCEIVTKHLMVMLLDFVNLLLVIADQQCFTQATHPKVQAVRTLSIVVAACDIV